MTLATNATLALIPGREGRASGFFLSQFAPGAAAFALTALAGAWLIYGRGAVGTDVAIAPVVVERANAANPYGALVVTGFSRAHGESSLAEALVSMSLRSSIADKPNPYGGLANMRGLTGAETVSLADALAGLKGEPSPAPQAAIAPPADSPAPAKRVGSSLVETVPLPPVRPALIGQSAPPPSSAPSQPNDKATPAVADNRSFFERLFGGGQPPASPPPPARPVPSPAAPQPSVAPTPVATAAPPPVAEPTVATVITGTQRNGGLGSVAAAGTRSVTVAALPNADRFTAVYDLSAHIVYMPDGTRLEAHSGLGDKMDDPRFVNERLFGATPPNTYELSIREASFHGVEALRLTPVGAGPLYGRAGLLAHPYMLGPNGDSNGCVSVKDYDAFLKAYKAGLIKRLVVVGSMN